MYSTEFFYNPPSDFNIKQNHLDLIRKLRSHESDESSYCSIMLQWRLSDNDDIISHDMMSDLFITMQLIVMCGEMTPEFKAKYDVKPYHESLLRRLYLEVDTDGSDYDDELITTGYKRPFGNSTVLGDVADELELNGIKGYDSNDSPITVLCESEFRKFIDILRAFMKEFKLDVFNFTPNVRFDTHKREPFDWFERLPHLKSQHSLLRYWKVSQVEERDSKIENILHN